MPYTQSGGSGSGALASSDDRTDHSPPDGARLSPARAPAEGSGAGRHTGNTANSTAAGVAASERRIHRVGPGMSRALALAFRHARDPAASPPASRPARTPRLPRPARRLRPSLCRLRSPLPRPLCLRAGPRPCRLALERRIHRQPEDHPNESPLRGAPCRYRRVTRDRRA